MMFFSVFLLLVLVVLHTPTPANGFIVRLARRFSEQRRAALRSGFQSEVKAEQQRTLDKYEKLVALLTEELRELKSRMNAMKKDLRLAKQDKVVLKMQYEKEILEMKNRLQEEFQKISIEKDARLDELRSSLEREHKTMEATLKEENLKSIEKLKQKLSSQADAYKMTSQKMNQLNKKLDEQSQEFTKKETKMKDRQAELTTTIKDLKKLLEDEQRRPAATSTNTKTAQTASNKKSSAKSLPTTSPSPSHQNIVKNSASNRRSRPK